MKKFDARKHVLFPKCQKLSEKEKEELLQRYLITDSELPKIIKNDPMVQLSGAKPGDVLRITRNSQTSGNTLFYRVIVHG